jgi:hypothetical protein
VFTFDKLSKHPRVFQRMTGLTLEEFNFLLDKFQSSWQIFVREEFLSKERKRDFGGGRHSRLHSLEDKLLFILVYTRIYPLMIVQGLFFGFEDSRACEWIHRLLPVLDRSCGFAHVKPRRSNGRSLEEILEEFPELAEFGITIDGVERAKRRPKDSEKQKSEYSGKKKRHTKKNVIIASPKNRFVLFLSRTRDGTVHDKRIIDEEGLACNDSNIMACTDLGFQGLKLGSLKAVMPKKNTKLHKLSDSDKEQNRAISSARVVVEHAIAGIKINRSVQDVYRNMTEGFDDLLMSVASGLHNLRVVHRQGF